MRHTPALLLLSLALLLSSCSGNRSDCISINEDGVPVIDIENITEEGELTFTDFLEDIQITRLETKEECLIDNVFRSYVTEDFIIIGSNKKGILLFDRDGKFIRQLTARGTGPGEVIGSYHLEYSEINQSLIIASAYYSKGFLKEYKLPSGEFSKLAIHTDKTINDIVIQDSVIYMCPLSFQEDNLRVIAQTISGSELFRINHTNEHNANSANIRIIDRQLMFNYSHGGKTMFLIEEGRLIPHSHYSVKGNMYDGFQQDIGDVLLFLSPVNSDMVRGLFSRVSGHESYDDTENKRATFDEFQTFIYDKRKESVYLIDRIRDDYFGSEKTVLPKQSNGMVSQYYDVQELFTLRDEINDDPEVSDEIKERLGSLCDKLGPDDNPVFLTAKIK